MSLQQTIAILDGGYVGFVEHWGSDERIIEAARMSTDKGFEGWGGAPCPECEKKSWLDRVDHLYTLDAFQREAEVSCKCKGTGTTSGDERLLKYLYINKHMTPFEMCGLTIEVKAPIFVFREWHRHRTASYNEMSARYVPLPDENYVPTLGRLKATAASNRQAQGTQPLGTDHELQEWQGQLRALYAFAQRTYEKGLRFGVPKELARLPVPVARYSRMRASANLRNWLAFMTLRCDSHAQWEIRQYADAVATLVENFFPRTFALWKEYF